VFRGFIGLFLNLLRTHRQRDPQYKGRGGEEGPTTADEGEAGASWLRDYRVGARYEIYRCGEGMEEHGVAGCGVRWMIPVCGTKSLSSGGGTTGVRDRTPQST
jgi:hypothetical protein